MILFLSSRAIIVVLIFFRLILDLLDLQMNKRIKIILLRDTKRRWFITIDMHSIFEILRDWSLHENTCYLEERVLVSHHTAASLASSFFLLLIFILLNFCLWLRLVIIYCFL